MGTEFFDELGETITRTAKELGERAEMLYESQKIRNKLAGEERIIDKVMADLGNLIYKRYSDGETVDEELCVLCEEIDQHMKKIAQYKAHMAGMRGQKICPSCEKAVDKDVSFCPYCGAACPNPEPEEESDVKMEPEADVTVEAEVRPESETASEGAAASDSTVTSEGEEPETAAEGEVKPEPETVSEGEETSEKAGVDACCGSTGAPQGANTEQNPEEERME